VNVCACEVSSWFSSCSEPLSSDPELKSQQLPVCSGLKEGRPWWCCCHLAAFSEILATWLLSVCCCCRHCCFCCPTPSGALSQAASSSTTALDAFLDMSADQWAAAGRLGGDLQQKTGVRGSAAAAAAAAGGGGGAFQRYGLDHPAAAADADGAEEAEGRRPQA